MSDEEKARETAEDLIQIFFANGGSYIIDRKTHKIVEAIDWYEQFTTKDIREYFTAHPQDDCAGVPQVRW